MLHGKFGGYQLMTAIHGVVTIETERGLAWCVPAVALKPSKS
jgi:hypothetical protein